MSQITDVEFSQEMSSFKRPKYSKAGYKRKFKSSKSGGKAVRGEVARQINRLIEDKTVEYTWTNLASNGLVPYNSLGWPSFNITPLFPVTTAPGFVIGQGSGQGNRVGNSIRPTKLRYRGVLCPNKYNASYNPIPQPQYCMLLLLSRKDTGNQVIGSTSLLYQNGSSSTNPTGLLYDVVAPFNYDLYNVYYKRVFKVGAAVNAGTGADAASQQFANNDFSRAVMFNIDLTKYYYKSIKFNDSTNTSTVGNGLHLAWYIMNGDGSAPVATDAPIQLTSVLELDYKDG